MQVVITQKIKVFSIENNILNIEYGKSGTASGLIESYSVTDSTPPSINLALGLQVITISWSSLSEKFKDAEGLVNYIKSNYQPTSRVGQDVVTLPVTDSSVTDADMRALHAKIEEVTGEKIIY